VCIEEYRFLFWLSLEEIPNEDPVLLDEYLKNR
jgi:hypothetical protein